MKVELTQEWCMNMAKIEARAAELHEGCQMPMEQARVDGPTQAIPYRHLTRLREPRREEVGALLYAHPPRHRARCG